MGVTRLVFVEVGDSLRRLAARHMGDANRWTELAEINGLRPPYIVESVDPADRERATLVFGDQIAVPVGYADRVPQAPIEVFGVDAVLTDRTLHVDATGDYAVVATLENLAQALTHRVNTPTGSILMHRAYGCNVFAVLGMQARPLIAALAGAMVRQALEQEPRLASVDEVRPVTEGDTVTVYARVTAADRNDRLDLNFVFPVIA
jgi:phage baseplate assembly protein W